MQLSFLTFLSTSLLATSALASPVAAPDAEAAVDTTRPPIYLDPCQDPENPCNTLKYSRYIYCGTSYVLHHMQCYLTGCVVYKTVPWEECACTTRAPVVLPTGITYTPA